MLCIRVTATFSDRAYDWLSYERSQSTCRQLTVAIYLYPCRQPRRRKSLLLLADVPSHLFSICVVRLPLVVCPYVAACVISTSGVKATLGRFRPTSIK